MNFLRNDRTQYFDKEDSRLCLLIVSGVWPHVADNYEAANVISFEITSRLADSGYFNLTYAVVNKHHAKIPESAEVEIETLRQNGVKFIEVILPDVKPKQGLARLIEISREFLNPIISRPGYGYDDLLLKALNGSNIDGALTIWSETGSDVISKLPVKKFAYHGNPDAKVFNARFEALKLVGAHKNGLLGMMEQFKKRLVSNITERGNLSVLRKFEFVANVAANDAAYYLSKGVRSFYIPNMWPTSIPDDWIERRNQMEVKNSRKIIGNVGNVGATGNSLGLIALGQKILPELKRQLGEGAFQIHIFGGGEVGEPLRHLLDDPHIIKRGFVEDLDSEIISAPVFLISNNYYNFKVSHTRFLHAWSLGSCVVAFRDCCEAMPEIKHGYNALLGATPQEVAQLVKQALQDQDLRRYIGRGGIETLQNSFSPNFVTKRLIEGIRKSF